MVLPIVQTGDPVLRHRSAELTLEQLRSQEIQELIEQMRETMRAAPGVGLAAPQIGRAIRLVVIEDPADLQTKLNEEELRQRERLPVPFHVLVNPRLTISTPITIDFFEGCLSVAGFTASTPRHLRVKVDALDQNGNEFSRDASGWYARILQHEFDHLEGILYVDRMHPKTFSTMENRARFPDASSPVVPH